MNLPRVLVSVTGSQVRVTDIARSQIFEYPLGALPAGAGDVRAYGEALFRALLAPAWEPVAADRRGVELALDLPAALHRLSWEAMHDGTDVLAAHRDLLVAVTRVIPADTPLPETVARTPRVLFASGARLTEPVIRPGAMFLGLLRECESEGLAITRIADLVTLDSLALRCAGFRPDLVHLVAHGDKDDEGRPLLRLADDWVAADRVVDALVQHSHPPVAVVLSACHSATIDDDTSSSIAASLIARGVPIVVAMEGEIGEQACRLFSKRLVRALLNGDGPAEAAAHGRRAALRAEPYPDDRLDWALPTVFTGGNVPGSFRPIDPEPARVVMRKARQLELVQRPVFIGHRAIFGEVDSLFSHGRALVAATSRGGFSKLGATRLLREIGLRLLQAGHLPLLLAPYTERTAPASLRHVVADILLAAVRAAERLELPVPVLTTLGDQPDGGPPPVVRQRLRKAIMDLRREETPLEARDLLAWDLETLARTAGRTLGEPFGEHTRVVVLAEALHLWTGALGWIDSEPPGLLDLLTPNGIGTAVRPAPVIATAALDECAPLRAFEADRSGMAAYRMLPLEALSPDEAALGYQWILLHPWLPDDQRVYVAAAGHDSEALRETFHDMLQGQPARVATDLYKVVKILARYHQFRSQDDAGAWRDYARLHGLGDS